MVFAKLKLKRVDDSSEVETLFNSGDILFRGPFISGGKQTVFPLDCCPKWRSQRNSAISFETQINFIDTTQFSTRYLGRYILTSAD
ncbi:hypothetical protein CEXT_631621 [Caerostris extrusa]|uniref:Uncharacterized protein n=1 Tax=Caerostris extrusa TaxID=172846 RepID=A0AAV4QG29_CAEEX|nr:hypothetical protein CEXT_631621 [Caerostris extrusa]